MELATHAGSVVYREKGGAFEYLLVSARLDPSQWVLPKGHIEPGETSEQAAVRETREEAGVHCNVVRLIARSTFVQRDVEVRVDFYLARFKMEVEAEETRSVRWCHSKTALKLLTHDNLKTILRQARDMLR